MGYIVVIQDKVGLPLEHHQVYYLGQRKLRFNIHIWNSPILWFFCVGSIHAKIQLLLIDAA